MFSNGWQWNAAQAFCDLEIKHIQYIQYLYECTHQVKCGIRNYHIGQSDIVLKMWPFLHKYKTGEDKPKPGLNENPNSWLKSNFSRKTGILHRPSSSTEMPNTTKSENQLHWVQTSVSLRYQSQHTNYYCRNHFVCTQKVRKFEIHSNVLIRREVPGNIFLLFDTHFKEAIEFDLSKAGKMCNVF